MPKGRCVIRIHMGPDDLGKVTFAPIATHAELIGSVRALRRGSDITFIDRWRRGALKEIPQRSRILFGLVPAHGGIPAFVMPAIVGGGGNGLGSIKQVVEAPQERVLECRELADPAVHGLIDRLVCGDKRAATELRNAFLLYWSTTFARAWTITNPAVQAELARRAFGLLTAGLDRTLAELGPAIRWHDQVLEFDSPADEDIDSAGRGLILVPSLFWDRPVYCEVAHAVAYPVRPAPAISGDGITGRDALGALLGRTRSAVLHEIASGGSNREIAARVGISEASTSEHAAVLRQAGLVATHRHGQAVRHALTSLGARLLRLEASAVPAEVLSNAAYGKAL